jgi:hypothetical protein
MEVDLPETGRAGPQKIDCRRFRRHPDNDYYERRPSPALIAGLFPISGETLFILFAARASLLKYRRKRVLRISVSLSERFSTNEKNFNRLSVWIVRRNAFGGNLKTADFERRKFNYDPGANFFNTT